MRVKYIGTTHKQDSIHGSNLHWHPEQVREVTPELGEKLTGFTDTWVRHEESAHQQVEKSEPVGVLKPEPRVEEPLAVVDFHGMTKKAMIEYSAEHFNVRLDPKHSEADLRVEITGLQAEHNTALAAEQAAIAGK